MRTTTRLVQLGAARGGAVLADERRSAACDQASADVAYPRP